MKLFTYILSIVFCSYAVSLFGMEREELSLDIQQWQAVKCLLGHKYSMSGKRYAIINWESEFPHDKRVLKELDDLTNRLDDARSKYYWQPVVTDFCKQHALKEIVLKEIKPQEIASYFENKK